MISSSSAIISDFITAFCKFCWGFLGDILDISWGTLNVTFFFLPLALSTGLEANTGDVSLTFVASGVSVTKLSTYLNYMQ